MSKILSLVGVMALIVSISSHAASFDCEKAASKVERLVCATAEVSDLDTKFAKAYESALSKLAADERNGLISEQRRWLQQSRNRCQQVTCLKHAYWERLARLETYFRPRQPELSEAELQKAVQALLNLGTFTLATGPGTQACGAILEDLKQMRDIRFVPPTAVAQTIEDISPDAWGKQCGGFPPMNYIWSCERGIEAADGDDEVSACKSFYGVSPFKLYEIPVKGQTSPLKFLYYGNSYGSMNRSNLPPALTDQGGFNQIDERQCVTARGNQWNALGKEVKWRPRYVEAGAPASRLGQSNLNSVIEYKGQYYFLHLRFYDKLYAYIDPAPRGNFVCRWAKN